jgi:hypothetical protein
MAKRFTDTEKWKKRWFRTLSNDHKVFWMYLLDNCCHAGIWEVDFDLASYFCQNINESEIRDVFKKQYTEFHKGKRWFLRDFIEFQYTTLNANVNAHKSVIQRLERYGLIHLLKTNEEGLNNRCLTVKDKDKDKTKIKNKKEDQIRSIDIGLLQEEFDSIDVSMEFKKWQDWMLSKGKTYKNYKAAFRNWLRSGFVPKKINTPKTGFLERAKKGEKK